jgi:hypothetical protein
MAGSDVQLGEDSRDVGFHGSDRYDQLAGDLGVGETVDQ